MASFPFDLIILVFRINKSYYIFHWIIIIIINIGATAQFEPRPSSEASASRPCSLQHSSSFFPPMSWHHP
jgi:hypothetical protein